MILHIHTSCACSRMRPWLSECKGQFGQLYLSVLRYIISPYPVIPYVNKKSPDHTV